MKRAEWEKAQNIKAVKFLKQFVARVLKGELQILSFGWWPGVAGRYVVSLTFKSLDEDED